MKPRRPTRAAARRARPVTIAPRGKAGGGDCGAVGAGAGAAPNSPRRHKPEMTLDRRLSRAGRASRAEAAEMIRAGRVSLAGRILRDPLAWVAADAPLRVDGLRLRAERRVYWALNKPAGVLTSHGDARGRATVYHHLPPELRNTWVFPVGRLDQDTSGLLLLTNDSFFAERVTNPASKVAKVYWAKINGLLTAEDLDRLRGGLEIGRGERSGPARAEIRRDNGRFCWVELEIREGKNRQVRRMFAALGRRVLKLTRIRIGALALGGLAVGAARPISPGEVFGTDSAQRPRRAQ